MFSQNIVSTLFKCATDGLRSEVSLPKPIDYCGDILMQSLSTGVIGLGIIALMIAAAQFFRYSEEERVPDAKVEAKSTIIPSPWVVLEGEEEEIKTEPGSLLRLDMKGL